MPSTPPGQLNFEASAYLQTLLGRELFRSDEFAIVELVKNASDSGATLAGIVVQPLTDKQPGEILVIDNGSGMSMPDFQRLFMTAGYSERGQQQTTKRVPTGEKGVGRFAADRLGTTLEVITRTKGEPEALRVLIDWNKFSDRRKRFGEITADSMKVNIVPQELNICGTSLRISGLRSAWTR